MKNQLVRLRVFKNDHSNWFREGGGESILATNLSALLATSKKDVVLVDADRQSTSAIWHQDRLATDKPKFDCIRLYDNISQTIKCLGNRYDFVIVDCQGRDSKELRSGLVVADLVLFPFDHRNSIYILF